MWNEQLTKEEYEKRREEIDLGDREVVKQCDERFWILVKSLPIRAVRNEKSENVTGNLIENSNNCYMVFRGIDCDRVRYADYAVRLTDSMDVEISSSGERCYETSAVSANSYDVKFSFQTRTCKDSEYIANCINCSNCFGCVGLRNKKYCILNTQYTPEEYGKVLDEIKTALFEAGEYGRFFEIAQSPYAYNSSLAQIVYPMTRDEAIARGFGWHDDSAQELGGLAVTPIEEVPKNIKDVGDDITNTAIHGEVGKAFRIIGKELEFYRAQNLPIPAKHPYDRMVERFGVMGNWRLYKATCSNCEAETLSSYKPDSGFRLYCEKCYQTEIV
jgi:CxxC-x17-CxxC domain-containing protein